MSWPTPEQQACRHENRVLVDEWPETVGEGDAGVPVVVEKVTQVWQCPECLHVQRRTEKAK